MLHVLPVRTGAAAENMALDFLLLQRYPEAAPDVALMMDFLSQTTPQRGIIR